MCDPGTLLAAASAALPLVAKVGSAAAVGGGTYMAAAGKRAEGKAVTTQAALEELVAQHNIETLHAQLGMQQQLADIPTLRAGLDEARTRLAGARVLNAQRAQVATNGLDPSFGSPLLMQGFSAAQVEADAGLIRTQGLLDKAAALAGVSDIAAKELNQSWAAVAAENKAKAAREAVKYGVGATYLSGASKMLSIFGGGGGFGGGASSAGGDTIPVNTSVPN